MTAKPRLRVGRAGAAGLHTDARRKGGVRIAGATVRVVRGFKSQQRKETEMTESKVVVERNPYNDTWEVGWAAHDEFDFTPYLCGYATREEAEAEIPGFDDRLKSDMQAFMQEKDANEREQNERFPNIGYVRAKIKKLRDRGNSIDFVKSFDSSRKLDYLLDLDLAEHITWPLPSWKAIKSGRVYGR
jgi:hypothetical protein